jgi:phage terminase small subunit
MTPKDFDSESVELWEACITQLKAQGSWVETDGELLGAYVRTRQLARELRKAVGSEYAVRGSRAESQLVPHPALKMAIEAEKDSLKYADALMLTPLQRKRHRLKTEQAKGSELSDVLS